MGLRLETKGAAVISALSGANINSSALSFAVSDATGWPDGTNGAFIVTLGRGTASEERVLCDSRTGTTLTVNASGRGYDGTAASSHNVGDKAEHTVAAKIFEDANKHHSQTTIDDHTQYMKADGTRHDLTARHTFGAALGTPGNPADVTTASGPGASGIPSREDHAHKLAAGAINASALFAAAVVNAAALGADAVTTVKLINDAVTTAKILDGAVTLAKLAANSVDSSKIVDGSIATADLAAAVYGPVVNPATLNQAAIDGILATLSRSDHVHKCAKPQVGGVACTVATTIDWAGGTTKDITGMTKDLTSVNANALLMVWGVFDIDITAHGSTMASLCNLVVDGVVQSGQAILQPLVTGHTFRATIAQMWLTTIPVAKTFTVKATCSPQAVAVNATTVMDTHSKFHYQLWD